MTVTLTQALSALHYKETVERFLDEDEEGMQKMLDDLYWDGLDDLVMDLLYEVKDLRLRARLSPYGKEGCGYDEVIDWQ